MMYNIELPRGHGKTKATITRIVRQITLEASKLEPVDERAKPMRHSLTIPKGVNTKKIPCAVLFAPTGNPVIPTTLISVILPIIV